MKCCPITYDIIPESENYSARGLKLLSPQLKNLAVLNLSAQEQREEAIARAGKMSIQGVQSKLSAKLKIKEGCFQIVDQSGQYILKPQSEYYPLLPENEALTMSLANIVGFDVPVCGLLYSKDHSMTYFIKRFDRAGHRQKLAIEDFAQLSEQSRNTKYNSSMEKIVKILFKYCTFPKIEAIKLFELTLFNFLIGNEDAHLKNFSLITKNDIVMLSPVYDLLNTTIAQKNVREEMALPLNGKKHNLKKKDFFVYLGSELLQLNQNTVDDVLDKFTHAIPQWEGRIRESFLSLEMQDSYLSLLQSRVKVLF